MTKTEYVGPTCVAYNAAVAAMGGVAMIFSNLPYSEPSQRFAIRNHTRPAKEARREARGDSVIIGIIDEHAKRLWEKNKKRWRNWKGTATEIQAGVRADVMKAYNGNPPPAWGLKAGLSETDEDYIKKDINRITTSLRRGWDPITHWNGEG